MEIRINKVVGLRNDLLITIPLDQIMDVFLSFPNWEKLVDKEGIPRWKSKKAVVRAQELTKSNKSTYEEHLKALGLLEKNQAKFRVVAIGNRNLGNNLGYVAWHSQKTIKFFRLKGEPYQERLYSCLIKDKDKKLSISPLYFTREGDVLNPSKTLINHKIEWATSGIQILRDGKIVNIEEIAGQFYDVRHLFGLDPYRKEHEEEMKEIYGKKDFDYKSFEERVRRRLEEGLQRARYLHNSIGLSEENLYILQREGTPEEIAFFLRESGARDALILDNGGSVGCWVWWIRADTELETETHSGGFIFTAPDFRPHATSIIAIKLIGPVSFRGFPSSASTTIL